MHIFILSPQQLSAGPGGTAIGSEKLFPLGMPVPGPVPGTIILLFGFGSGGPVFLLLVGLTAAPQVAHPAILPLSCPPPSPVPPPVSLQALSSVLSHVHSLPKFPPFNTGVPKPLNE